MMNNSFGKSKRVFSGIAAGCITAAAMLAVFPSKAETAEKYPYTLFAASHEEGAITFNSDNVIVNGNVFTNGTVSSPGNVNINGTLCENADADMIYIFDRIDEKYFSGRSVNEVENDYLSDEENITIDKPTVISGETTLVGDISVSTALKSLEDVTLIGEVKNKNNSLIFSKYGDISIEYDELSLNGLIYAPNGNVRIKADRLTLNNVVIIADTITLECPDININYGPDAAQFVGLESEGEYRTDSTEAYLSIPSGEDFTDTDDGISCVKNQLLVTAAADVPYCDVEAYFNKYNAKIVGYIAITNDYQIELDTADEESLNAIAEDCLNDRRFEFVSLNTAVEQNSDYYPSDELWNTDEWNESVPNGVNWNAEAINAPSAWDYIIQMGQKVKIGLIDGMFDTSHEDLTFTEVWNNPLSAEVMKNEHGTHVAGIMAANFDNGTGISGISINNELYAYSVKGTSTDSDASRMTNTVMEYKYAFALLASNNVRVINFSQNNGRLECFAASHGNENAINYYRTNAEILQRFLEKLLDYGYDFTIVTAAGNVNEISYRKENSAFYGYITDGSGTEKGNALAEYNSFLNYPYSERIADRVICVGSIGCDSDGNNTSYHYSSFSNIGERVDVAAPGENILSTIPGDDYCAFDGTSMSAAHVSGIAGLLYSINPGLTGDEVKKLIVKSASDRTVTDSNNESYGIPDAKKAIVKTISSAVNTEENVAKPRGTVIGKIADDKNIPAAGAGIAAHKITGTSVAQDFTSFTSADAEGNFELILDPGTYRLYINKESLVPIAIDVDINAGDAVYLNPYLDSDSSDGMPSQNSSETTEIINSSYRIELVWDDNATDLDSHLTGPSEDGRFHLYYSNMEYTGTNGFSANLSYSQNDNKPCETVILDSDISNDSIYRFSVHNFTAKDVSDSYSLSTSGAQVRLYSGDTLIETYTVPVNQTGTLWNVFEIRNGTVNCINTLSNQTNPDHID